MDREPRPLPEPLRLLVSGYAAGDLSPRRRKAALRLLKHSKAARTLLAELRENTRRLRALPRRTLPADFADKLLSALPDNRPIIRLDPPPVPARSRWRWAVPVAIAAAVGALGIGLILSEPQETRQRRSSFELAQRTKSAQESEGIRANPTPPDSRGSDTGRPPEDAANKPVAVANAAPNPTPAPTTPAPTESSAQGVLANRPTPAPKLVQVDPPRLLVLPVRDLTDAGAGQRLQQALAKVEPHRIDLFSRDPAQAFDRVQEQLKARGVRVVLDAVAQEALKRKQPIPYLIYCDDLTPADWTGLLKALGEADQGAEAKHSGDGLFNQIVHMPLSAADQKDLTTLLGADPIAAAQRSGRPAPERAGGGKAALVVPYVAVHASPSAKEFKQLLDGPRERAPGAAAVMLVIRLPSS